MEFWKSVTICFGNMYPQFNEYRFIKSIFNNTWANVQYLYELLQDSGLSKLNGERAFPGWRSR